MADSYTPGKVLAKNTISADTNLTKERNGMSTFLVIMDETEEARAGAALCCKACKAGGRSCHPYPRARHAADLSALSARVQATIEQEARETGQKCWLNGAAGNIFSAIGHHACDHRRDARVSPEGDRRISRRARMKSRRWSWARQEGQQPWPIGQSLHRTSGEPALPASISSRKTTKRVPRLSTSWGPSYFFRRP